MLLMLIFDGLLSATIMVVCTCVFTTVCVDGCSDVDDGALGIVEVLQVPLEDETGGALYSATPTTPGAGLRGGGTGYEEMASNWCGQGTDHTK